MPLGTRTVLSIHPFHIVAVACITIGLAASLVAAETDDADLAKQFDAVIFPFLQSYCFGCHGVERQESKLDLSGYASISSVRDDLRHWEIVLERLEAEEMPPDDAPRQPQDTERQSVINWIQAMRTREANRHAGDPGPVLPRRLSNAEYDYTIRDLTGIDIRPTQDFPIDPANEAGFDTSGESLTMSPALLQKYFEAARHIADHLVLLPEGFTFAPHAAVTDTDRDKFCVARIVDFYKRQEVDYADYFFVAWIYQHRSAEANPHITLAELAERHTISVNYLGMIHASLADPDDDLGPLAQLRTMWNALPKPGERPLDEVRIACEQMRDFVVQERRKLAVPIDSYRINGLNPSTQPLVLWKNDEMASNRRRGKIPDAQEVDSPLRDAIDRFCQLFPDTFFVSQRGRMFINPKQRNEGRLLSAGFHLMVGYYRDDQPLYDLILDAHQRQQLDRLWKELDFVTRAPTRQFQDFVYFERAESPRILAEPEFDFARGEDKDVTSVATMDRLAKAYVAALRHRGIDGSYVRVVEAFFENMSARIQRLEKARTVAQPSHLDALLAFADRAWRRPLLGKECDELLAFYRQLRDKERLDHESAVRDVLVTILMSPHFCYRVDLPAASTEVHPVSSFSLASRLSYFLWSSMPDDELMEDARQGRLRDPATLIRHSRRMRQDWRVEGLATEFAGNWLEFRHFRRHQGVNRERFQDFDRELQQAMFAEPVRFLVDLMQRDGSVLELLNGRHTFVNSVLAKHYGMTLPASSAAPDHWVRIDDAVAYGRGGLLPMSVFLTKNSPGLRTSPVKRGYWVVRRLLGEHIPAPPPEVPELPDDEAKLGNQTLREMLARHREVKSCASCHDRFDSMGLAFEGYDPIGRRRTTDAGGRPIDSRVTFPDGSEGRGVESLRRYLTDQRRDEFVDNLSRKLLAYALGRRLLLSDNQTIEEMKAKLVANDYRFGSLIESIVTSEQFRHQRGRDFVMDHPR